ncbi:unnamed protein product [Rotaria socialis]|uniref:CCHC-type domain-containing protein n=1 Tax=Rotaria socialis TaxID=392032 RepID=A0A817YRN7_9BILA|nr:unnamed protein product [Rotaria socialis]CAF3573907.1 unnamed protein product [Rotaria socialis]CAF4472506.1 unnamed protein product [Rotaria socialis]CAF4612356.1 unnamed protein product [Rotaria socialis]
MSLMQEIETNSMETRQLHSSQKEAIKKITEFSGESTEIDIDEWLYDLNNLFSLMKLKDETRILETMGKLAGPALRWYQENLRSFINWNDAEKALRDRFKEFTSDSQLMQEFVHIHQEENQSVTSFYEHVIRKYRKARQCITEQQVITVLQTGVKNSLKEYLIRNEKDITKPDEWLQYARQEEYIEKRIQQQRNNFYSETTNQPFFEPMLQTATIQSKSLNAKPLGQQPITPHHYYQQQHQHTSKFNNNRMNEKQIRHPTIKSSRPSYPKTKMHRSESCLICNRKNHSTMNCFYKKDNGCFKCGQSNHRIRDCPEQHFFE